MAGLVSPRGKQIPLLRNCSAARAQVKQAGGSQEMHLRSALLSQTKTLLDEVSDSSLFLLTLDVIIFYTFKGSS